MKQTILVVATLPVYENDNDVIAHSISIGNSPLDALKKTLSEMKMRLIIEDGQEFMVDSTLGDITDIPQTVEGIIEFMYECEMINCSILDITDLVLEIDETSKTILSIALNKYEDDKGIIQMIGNGDNPFSALINGLKSYKVTACDEDDNDIDLSLGELLEARKDIKTVQDVIEFCQDDDGHYFNDLIYFTELNISILDISHILTAER